MMIHQLGVDPPHRRQRVGTTLVRAMEQLAPDLSCHGMWVTIDAGDATAIATYRAGGAENRDPPPS